MRSYHRWAAALAAVFLLIVSATGVILQVQKLTGGDPDSGGREEEGRAGGALTTAMPSPVYAALIARTLDAARSRAPASAVSSVSLTGDERRDKDSLILRIHSGEILGEPGVFLGILWGLGLVILSLTGGWVYLAMYRRRRRASGKGSLFWK